MNGILRTSDELHGQGRTVLVIDDNLADLRLMSDYLEEVGLGVLDARNGEEGLEKARHAQPDLILLDALMPGVDGLETLRRLKADKALQEVPVILMMEPSIEEGWRKGFQLGAEDYIAKPFQHEAVVARVATHLRLRDLTRKVDEAEQALERGVENRTAELVSANAQMRAELAELRRAEEAWKESEEQHRITLENILDPVFITNDEGQFTFVCTNVSHILGYAMEEMQAMGNIAQLVGVDLFNLEELRVVGQIPNIERVIVDRQGRERTFLITVKWVSIKKGTILYACRDVTERRRAEEALSRSLEAATKQKEELQRLSNQLLDAQEAERKRISLELHDELGQALTVIGINLEELERTLPSEVSPQLREILVETISLADETLEQVREMALGLRPSLLDDLGLVPALRWYLDRLAQRLPIEISFEATDGRDRLPPQVETAIYRIVQEALTNITRHAQASRVHVHLECTASAIMTTIEDDGRGFDPEAAASRGGVGLLGMRERAVLLGGSVSINSRPGRGTRLTLKIPWGADA